MFKPFTDPDGTLLVTEDPIDAKFGFNGGFAYAPNGAIAIETTAAGDLFIGGFAATNTGRLVVETDGVIGGYVQGLPVTATGELVTKAAAVEPTASFVGGLAVNSDGVPIRSIVPPPAPPVAFSSAFSGAFK